MPMLLAAAASSASEIVASMLARFGNDMLEYAGNLLLSITQGPGANMEIVTLTCCPVTLD